MDIESPVYAFTNGKEFRCLGNLATFEDAESLKKDGWKHVATYAAHVLIENMLNGDFDYLKLENEGFLSQQEVKPETCGYAYVISEMTFNKFLTEVNMIVSKDKQKLIDWYNTSATREDYPLAMTIEEQVSFLKNVGCCYYLHKVRII